MLFRSIPPRVRHLLAQRRFLVVALVVLWAAELFVVQEATLVEEHYYAAFQPLLHRAVRGSLDLLACAALVLLLPRAGLALLFAVGTVLSGVLLSFARHTGHALSATMMMSTAGEGTAVAGAGYAVLPAGAGIALLAVFAAKMFLVYRMGKVGRPPLSARWPLAAKLGAVYLIVIALTSFYKPFRLLLGWESVGGIGSVYGYTPTWVAELVLLDREEILERAKRRAATRADGLDGLEAPFPVGDRLVFLQVESLDHAIMDFEVNGQPVTPELRAIAARSMSYVIQSAKKTGSCDADFTALMGGLPSEDMPNYKIAGFPFGDSFVRDLERAGYRTVALHNVGGAFFNRRPAFTEMGFDELVFKEEMVAAGLEDDGWATPDHVMLRHAAERIAASRGPSFFMVITATSHIPFHYTPADQRRFYPEADDLTRSYVDSIHYVDAAIGDFVDRLPEGTVVVLYGDHGSGVGDPEHGYVPTFADGVGLVPFLIYRVGDDLSGLQRTRESGLASSGELTLLDLVTYVHDTVRARGARH